MARQQDALARQSSQWPATTAMTPGGTDVPTPVVWSRRWDTAADHEQLARMHRSEADSLHVAFDDACGNRPTDQITTSPIMRFGMGGTNTKDGVEVYLDPAAGGPDSLLADLRCHRAWMMLGPTGMDDCPLDLPGLLIDAKGDKGGVTLTMSVKDPRWIAELQRRVALDLESGRRMHRQGAHD